MSNNFESQVLAWFKSMEDAFGTDDDEEKAMTDRTVYRSRVKEQAVEVSQTLTTLIEQLDILSQRFLTGIEYLDGAREDNWELNADLGIALGYINRLRGKTNLAARRSI